MHPQNYGILAKLRPMKMRLNTTISCPLGIGAGYKHVNIIKQRIPKIS